MTGLPEDRDPRRAGSRDAGGAVTLVRPRVPNGATFLQYGMYAQDSFDLLPERLRLSGALRYDLVRANALKLVCTAVFGSEDKLPEKQPPRHLAIQINNALHDLFAKYPETLLFGEDVAQKGGVYTVTKGLHKAFKAARVFNTLLDETMILGLAQGFANLGMLPIPEIQYLAYFHNACDQIRGEAASLQFFSNDQFRNPMVVRIAGLGYQRGFGGHFHNDNSLAIFRDIPGLVLAVPSNGADAVEPALPGVASPRFDSLAALAEKLQSSPAVSACLAEKVFLYMNGRDPETDDHCTVESAEESFSAAGQGFRSLVSGLVESPAFRLRRAPSLDSQAEE